MVLDVANAAPLPEAKPNDVGFSQQVLARLDDFFAREMAAKPKFSPLNHTSI